MADLTAPPIRTALINNPDGSPFLQVNGQDQGQLSTEKSWYYYWNNAGRQINANTLTLSQLVTHGTHADRPDPSTVVDGAIYVEHDRGVLYQNWSGSWRYVAGTMYGSLSPDQRPTDLGLADGGFEFRSVDANTAYAPKHFVWSQTAWIDATQVLYGTHAGRPTADYHTPARTLYIETDRGSVIYQNQANVWTYCGGSWSSVLSARPADLGAADVGFVFIATDTGQTFRWNGTAWVETTPIAGGSSLIHPNVVTKVGSTAGQIVEGGITDQSAANSNSVYIDSTGKVGIGTTSPVALLTVAIASSTISSIVRLRNLNSTVGTGTGFLVSMTNSAASEVNYGGMAVKVSNSTAGSEVGMLSLRTAIPSGLNDTVNIVGQNVGIGTAAPAAQLDCAGMIRTTGGVSPASGSGMEMSFQGGNAYIVAYNRTVGAALPLSVIASTTQFGSTVGVGVLPTFQFQVSTDSAAKPGTSTWTVVSDLKLKQNVEPVKDDSLAILGKLDWIRYEYNGKANTPQGLKAIGLAAQELQVQLPEAVRSTKTKLNETDAAETDVLAIDYHHILVHSARAIQQLNAEVQALKALLAKPQ